MSRHLWRGLEFILLPIFWSPLCVSVSTQTRNLPVLELAFPFPVLAPISSTVLFWIPLPEIFHLVRYPNTQFASTGTGRDSFVPFPVLGSASSGTVIHYSLGPVPELDSMRTVPFPVRGSASSGTVIHWAPYRNWTLCARYHFRYGALPVPIWSFLWSRTKLCAQWVCLLVCLWLVCMCRFYFRGT